MTGKIEAVPRLRLGVALLVPEPVASEVDVLRRACGHDEAAPIAPHLTLVPPVNVREDRLSDALTVLRGAAAQTRPFALSLGPPRTFLPTNPVLYLAVGGQVEELQRLRHAVFSEPLSRSLTWPFLPHVTVCDGGDPSRLAAAVDALAGYRAEVRFERVHLLREGRDDAGERVWRTIADAPMAAQAVVGRGGLPLDLVASEALDPGALAFLARELVVVDAEANGGARYRPLVVAGRRKGEVVGIISGWTGPSGALVGDVVVAAAERRQGVGAHLVAAFVSEVADRGCSLIRLRTEVGSPTEAFWRQLGWVEEAIDPDTVQLRRDLS